VSYFYFDFNDMEKQSSRKAIRSLLFQFTLQSNDIVQDLERLYQKCGSGQQQPPEGVIQSLFKGAVVYPGQKYIILDALDECTDREDLLTFIRELMDLKLRNLHILATSRREKDIEDELSSIANYNIDIQSSLVDADIRIYIRDRMATDIKLKKWPDSVQNEIITALMEKAGGMYV
jgi:ankyrin repeat domain-containing protein 50